MVSPLHVRSQGTDPIFKAKTMATNSADGQKPPAKDSLDSKKPTGKVAKGKPLVPPDEKFWERYSPHHEFALSLSSSGVLHVAALGLVVLASLAGWVATHARAEVDTIEIAGGGGQPEGVGDKNTGPNLHEDVQDAAATSTSAKPDQTPQELKDVTSNPKPLINPDQPLVRPVEETVGLGKNLDTIGKQAMEKLAALQHGTVSKGQGGSGEGGGKGKGKGKGYGDLEGSGRMKITKREQRQLRWTMVFNIRQPEDYARQLNGLKAILAIPISAKDDRKEYKVIRDLSRRPVHPKVEDVTAINRIYWVDDRPESVASLARVLGVEPPSYFVAFFPPELEQLLLKKELAYAGNKPEEKIRETKFQVRATANGYEPFVIDQATD
jgi:hypothetical protein